MIKYKSVFVSEKTHARIIQETTRGGKKRSADKVINDLLDKNDKKIHKS